MTLENCKKLLKHYEETKQEANACEMRERIALKEKLPQNAKETKSVKEK